MNNDYNKKWLKTPAGTLYKASKRLRETKARVAKKIADAGRLPTHCDVCRCEFVEALRTKLSACWDHNHSTKQFRGWLCLRCNSALGMAGDNPTLLDALSSYLRQRGCSPTRS